MDAAKTSTKDRIIESSIDLFSEKGFYETSIREIAKKCNLQVSSLYSHFSGKEEILDDILKIYREELVKVRIPDERIESLVNSMSLEEILAKGFTVLIDTTSSLRMNKIIKIMVMEMYRNPKVRDFYTQWYFNENRISIMNLFKRLQAQEKIKKVDLEMLTSVFGALMNYFYHEYFLAKLDHKDTKELEQKIEQHLECFVGLIK